MSTSKPAPSPAPSPGSPQAVSRTLQMRHPATGESVQVPLGYSLPVLLLGPIELARRRDWPLVAVSVLLPIVGQIFLAPIANRSYLKRLLRQGFRAVSPSPGYIGRIEWQLGMLLPRYTGRSNKSAD
ncbi:hypothetical protein [Sphaerotilus sp.]|uniref:hypothetical protein n=1 Tax=Sphaerotilus sp. TaxID=2093942 RepID=UPI0025E1917D|nr:hypothetical protein [Sphaerotilus sp.]